MLTLKGYQQRAIDTLDGFLSQARDRQNVTDAYAEALQEQGLPPLAYRDYGFADVPYVCFRIPTGGGKTLLASQPSSRRPKAFWMRIFRLLCGWFPATPFGNKPSRL